LIYAVSIQRGGTAKTTTAVTLAQAAAHRGKTALVIDLDPQGNASFILRATAGDNGGSLSLLEGQPAAGLIQAAPGNVSIIPAARNLAAVSSSRGSARRLQQALKPLKGKFDFVFIDTPPTAGELQYNALQAAEGLIIPLQADILGLQGLYQIAEAAQQIQATNPALKQGGYILTRYNPRSNIARKMEELIAEKGKEYSIPLYGTVREGIAIREAQALRRSLYEYAPNSNPAKDYLAIFDRIANESK